MLVRVGQPPVEFQVGAKLLTSCSPVLAAMLAGDRWAEAANREEDYKRELRLRAARRRSAEASARSAEASTRAPRSQRTK